MATHFSTLPLPRSKKVGSTTQKEIHASQNFVACLSFVLLSFVCVFLLSTSHVARGKKRISATPPCPVLSSLPTLLLSTSLLPSALCPWQLRSLTRVSAKRHMLPVRDVGIRYHSSACAFSPNSFMYDPLLPRCVGVIRDVSSQVRLLGPTLL